MKSIAHSILVPVTDDQSRRLERIDSENYSGVARKVAEDHLATFGRVLGSGYIERGIFALKQYYAIAMLDPANAHAVTLPIDPFWHAHILFTSQYRCFCDDVVGEYMDHVPLDKGDRRQVENVGQLYSYTLSKLPVLFDHVDAEFWPRQISEADLICYHKGNQSIYLALQADRLFEPSPAGRAWAFA